MKSKKREEKNTQLELSLSYDNPEDPVIRVQEKHPILSDKQYEPNYTESNFIQSDSEESCGYDIAEKCGNDITESFGLDIAVPPIRPKTFGHSSAVAIVLLEIIGICCVAATVIKAVTYHGGFAWNGGEKEFNFHSVFMIIGLVFCYANAAISSYIFSRKSETVVHYLHGFSILATFVLTVIGMVAAVQFRQISIDSSFHEWLGVITLILFGFQAIAGFLGLFPKCGYEARKKYLKFQVWIALLVFTFSIATCLLGFNERLSKVNITNTHTVMNVRILTNIISFILVLFGILVTTVLLHPLYRYVNEEEIFREMNDE